MRAEQGQAGPRFGAGQPFAVYAVVHTHHACHAGSFAQVTHAHAVLLKGKGTVKILDVGLTPPKEGAPFGSELLFDGRNGVPGVLHSGLSQKTRRGPIAQFPDTRGLRIGSSGKLHPVAARQTPVQRKARAQALFPTSAVPNVAQPRIPARFEAHFGD
ncbi:MAG: hypothetical protein EBZ22_08770, partial [Flavobacteriia bacterium]|nr:hypothetical protein [Flavobacteriia bacterium]